MTRPLRLLLAASRALMPGTALAQAPPLAGESATPAEVSAARGADGRSQVALEIGFLSAGISYARRVGDTPFSVGAGVWGAWEPPNTFDRPVFEPTGVAVFGRYRPAPWLHADVGLTSARYLWADDCHECSGMFTGVRSAVLVGRGMVFVGPELSAGWASDDRHGSELGVLWGGQLRLVLGWGP
jgi:hypothetical protein